MTWWSPEGWKVRRQRRSGSNAWEKSPAIRSPGRGTLAVVLLALLLTAVGLYSLPRLLLPRQNDPGTLLNVGLSGFRPTVIRGRVGEPIRVTMVNLDDHTRADGAGWHSFVLEALGVREAVGPGDTHTFTLRVNEPGVYLFFCDVCCGGRESPHMRGELVITR